MRSAALVWGSLLATGVCLASLSAVATEPELREVHRAIFCGEAGYSETSAAYAAEVAAALARRTARGASVRDALDAMRGELCRVRSSGVRS